MAERFDVCLRAGTQGTEQRRALLLAIASRASRFMPPLAWTMRVRGREVSEGEWCSEPVDVPDGWIVFFYPKKKSSADGAVAVEVIGSAEVWTLALPVERTRGRLAELEDLMWNLSSLSESCVAGIEYSMGEVLRSGRDVLADIADPHSLATYAVVRQESAPRGWVTVRAESGRSLVRKADAVR